MRPTERAGRARPRSVVAVAVAALLTTVCVGQLQAQLPYLLEGLVDGEAWSTTQHSNLLTRNGGRPATLARVQLWGAVEPFAGLVFYGQSTLEGGPARPTAVGSGFELTADMFGVRYSRSSLLVVDAGKMQPVVGTFAPRHFSNRNPLIGSPDAYTLQYPVGVLVSGETRHFDYRGGAISLPPTHRGYVPEATARLRPAIGGGFTPVVGMRIGASYTAGPYLNDHLTTEQLRGQPWTQYAEHVTALDAKFARGYLETYAEAARATYDVPGHPAPILGYAYYGEAKYTLTPRVFIAGRLERNNYPFIRPFSAVWVARPVDFVNGELGVGYRLTASTLLKLSARGDRWWVAPGASGFLGQGGPAVAMQLSQSFDVRSWFDRVY